MLFIKPGVRIMGMRPEIAIAVFAAERVYAEAGHELTITACIDGKHQAGSLHYVGQAVDLRTVGIPAPIALTLVSRIKACLGGDFDVVSEANHIHVEFQPKLPVTSG